MYKEWERIFYAQEINEAKETRNSLIYLLMIKREKIHFAICMA